MTAALVSAIEFGSLALLWAVDELEPAQRADTGQMLIWLLGAGAAIGVVSVVLMVANRIARRWRFNSHPSLFYGLCKVHGLDSAARRLLKRAVRFHRLAQPSLVFVEPKWLDPANLGPSFRRQAAELERLRNRLFSVRPKAAGAE